MTSLYEISVAFRDDAARLTDLELDDQTILDTLEGMSDDLQVKAQNVVMFARNLESTAAAIKDAEAQMAARRKAIENRAASLRRYVLSSMQIAGVTKIECPYFRLSIQNNPPAVDIYEPDMVPADLMVFPEAPPAHPDKKAIAAAIKAGREVPGATLTQSQRLVIA